MKNTKVITLIGIGVASILLILGIIIACNVSKKNKTIALKESENSVTMTQTENSEIPQPSTTESTSEPATEPETEQESTPEQQPTPESQPAPEPTPEPTPTPEPEPQPTPEPEPQPAPQPTPEPAPVEVPKEDITVIVGPGAGTQNLDANAGPTVPCPYTFGEYTTRKYYNGDGAYTLADGYYDCDNIYLPGNPSFEYEDVVFPNGKKGREIYSLYVGTYDCGPVWFMMFLYN